MVHALSQATSWGYLSKPLHEFLAARMPDTPRLGMDWIPKYKGLQFRSGKRTGNVLCNGALCGMTIDQIAEATGDKFTLLRINGVPDVWPQSWLKPAVVWL